MSDISKYAEAYIRRYGIAVVQIEPGTKGPRGNGWNKPGGYFTDPIAASDFFAKNSNWNMGAVLGPSGLCSLDVDNVDAARVVLSSYCIDVDALADSFPTIVGNPARFRVSFHVPAGVELARKSLTWPNRDDPDGSKHAELIRQAIQAKKSGDDDTAKRLREEAKQFSRMTVIEFRAGDVQDVLPPSMHPGTGKPYTWRTKPNGHFPELPAEVLALWQNWADLRERAETLCPWRPKQTKKPATEKQRAVALRDGMGVIETFNTSQSIENALDSYGYERHGDRWLSPHSSTGEPGIWIQKPHNRAWNEHASDPLCSTNEGRPVSPFDLFCYYEHGGDAKKAVKAAAEVLGMSRPAPPTRRDPPPNVDIETGEIIEPAADQFIDTMTFLPDTTDKGKPLATIENVGEICRRLGVRVRYNVISKEEEILIPNESFSIDNQANASLAWLTSWCARFRMPTDKLGDFVTYLADQKLYNPVAEWINSKPWDGTSRLQQLYDTIASTDDTLKAVLIKRWLISAVAAAFNPNGVSAHGVLVLQGDQYLGKTKWFKSLVPEQLGLVKDGMILRPDDKDSVKQVCSFWLVELGELDATFRKSDIAQLKSFITNQSDVLRRAYARKESHFARRTVFFGSVNPKQFLHDTTGNRRYWTIECEEINHSHNIDMQQLWAEVLTLYKSGETHYLTPEEMMLLNDHNESFQVADPVEERLSVALAWDSDKRFWEWKTATEVLLAVGFDRPTLADSTKAAHFLRKRNGNFGKRSGGKNLILVPNKL